MASAAEQLAANINFGAIAKAEELKKRIWFTLGALIVYRLGTYIPLPGIDPEALRQSFANAQGGVLGLFNMSSGGLRAFSGITVGLMGSLFTVHASLAVAAVGFTVVALVLLVRLPRDQAAQT